MANNNNNIVIKCGFDPNRSVTQVTQVGTNADLLSGQTEQRGVLPTFTDANTKYYKSTGNDGTGDGTFANPYLTFYKALQECHDDVAAFVFVVGLDNVTNQSQYYFEHTSTKNIGCYANTGTTTTLKYPNSYVTSDRSVDTKTGGEFYKIYVPLFNNNQDNEVEEVDASPILVAITTNGSTYYSDQYYNSNNQLLKKYDGGYEKCDIIDFNDYIYISSEDGIGNHDLVRVDSWGVYGETSITTSLTQVKLTKTDNYIWFLDGNTIKKMDNAYSVSSSFLVTGADFLTIESLGNKLVAYDQTNKDLYYSVDEGANWNLAFDLTALALSLNDIKRLKDSLYFYDNYNLYKIKSDFSGYDLVISNKGIYNVDYYNNHIYIKTARNGVNDIIYEKYTLDGNYIQIFIDDSESILEGDFGFYNGMFYYNVDDGVVPNQLRQIDLKLLTIEVNVNNSITFNGIKFDGNNLSHSNLFVFSINNYYDINMRYCNSFNSNFNLYLYTKQGLDGHTFEIDHSIIHDSNYGIISLSNDSETENTYNYNLMYNINSIGLLIEKISDDCTFNTFYAINDLFYVGSNYIYLYDNIIQNIYSNVLEFYNVTSYSFNFGYNLIDYMIDDYITYADFVAFGNQIGNPLFYDVTNYDFRIKIKEAKASNNQYFKFDSPAKTMDSGTVMIGCYIYTWSNSDNEYKYIINTEYKPNEVEINYILKNYAENTDLNGDLYKFNRGNRLQMTFNWNESHQPYEHFFQILKVFNEKLPVSVFPNFPDPIAQGTGNFIAPTQIISLDTMFELDRYSGYWVEVIISAVSYWFMIDTQQGDLIELVDLNEYALSSNSACSYKIWYINMIPVGENIQSNLMGFYGMRQTNKYITYRNYSLTLEAYHNKRILD